MNQAAFSLFESADSNSSNVVALVPKAREGLHKGDGPGSASEEVLLGQLVWYSVSDAVRLLPEKLATAISAAGLDANRLMPRAPTPTAAPSRAAEAAEVKRSRIEQGRSGESVETELYANVLVRSASRGVKQVVTEVVDAGEARLSYRPVAIVSPAYSGGKPEGTLRVVRSVQDGDVHGGTRLLDVEIDAISNLRRYFAFEKDRHDSEAARRVLGRALAEANAIPLRNSGGMYFIPRGRSDDARKVLAFVEAVRVRAEKAPTKAPRASMAMSVPLVDREEYREVLAESVEYFVKKEAESLISEMSSLLKGDNKISGKRGRAFVERVRTLKASVAEYEELLEVRATEARANLEVAAKEAKALLSRIDAS